LPRATGRKHREREEQSMSDIGPVHPRAFPIRYRAFTTAMTLALAVLVGTALGADAPLVDDEVVSLPPMLVEERETPLRWRYVAAGNLELLSVCSDEVTRAFAQRCLQLDEVLKEFLPERFQFRTVVPRVHIL